MTIRRKTTSGLTAFVALAAVAMPTIAPSAASADSPGRATKPEFKQVRNGDSEHRVTDLFDTSGRLSIALAPYQTRKYNACAKYSSVSVSYKHHRVTDKMGIWF